MKFFNSGRPVGKRPPPRSVILIQEFLDSVKNGELLNVEQVAEATGLSSRTINTESRIIHLKGYTYVYQNRKYWGNPRTIKALERKDHEQRKRGN